MKISSIVVISALALSTGSALSIKSAHENSRNLPNGVVQLEMRHYRKGGRIGKRANDDVYGSYSIAFNVGTPPQKMQALLDTGSSDLWVNTPEAKQPISYDPEKSSTYKFNNSNFHIRYGSGSAHGNWATDVVTISGAPIHGQSLGVVSSPRAGQPIFGIGLIENESSNTPYVNVPQNLKNQGHIKHNAYSLYLDNLEASTGRVLFGGVDQAKYEGELLSVPAVDNAAFYIEVHDIRVGGSPTITAGSNSFPGLVDSGTTFTYVPAVVAKRIAQKFDATYDSVTGLYFVNEKTTAQPDFEFDFSGATIKVPAREMVVESSQIIEGEAPMPYVLGVVPSLNPPYILGDTFMRSAYVVYDLEGRHLSLAQSSFSKETDIRVIDGAIPGAKLAPNVEAT